MLPTPSTSHISFANVYEPAEDSFLLLDTLSSPSETTFLQSRFSDHNASSPLMLEVGTGSGVVLAFATAHAQSIFGRRDIVSLGTDINIFACHGSSQTAKASCREHDQTASVFANVLNADLAAPFRPGQVDVLIFNPPYVPTEAAPDLSRHTVYNDRNKLPHMDAFERDSHLLSLSYAGGLDGMEVTERLLEELPNILHPRRGVAYVLLCAQNKPGHVVERMNSQHGFQAQIVGTSGKQAGWEKLCVLRVWKD